MARFCGFACAIFLFFLPRVQVHAQASWPCNDIIGAIEFTGTMDWPVNVKSQNQKCELLKQWFEKKISDISIYRLKNYCEGNYCKIPNKAYIKNEKSGRHFQLNYDIDIIENKIGISYKIHNFEYGIAEEDASVSWDLESALVLFSTDVELAAFRERIVNGLSSW